MLQCDQLSSAEKYLPKQLMTINIALPKYCPYSSVKVVDFHYKLL
jgi:hypothetical protein